MPKSPAKILQDKGVDEAYPYLPISYVAAVRQKFRAEKNPLLAEMTSERLHNVVRKRGTEPDWVAYEALLSVKEAEPVERKPRKQHKPRRHLQTA